ncbi:MAG: T9SS type A sorting domain-containing protein [Ignavibacteria bacterium]|nr:T9SS type A sorting domain-containing protein [Ignavibacteria bacterium]
MKTNINPIKAVLFFTFFLTITMINYSSSSAQFLNPDRNQAKQIPLVFHAPGLPGQSYFDLSKISGSRPDVAVTSNAYYSTFNQHIRDGQWNSNNGDGNFGAPIQFINEMPSSDINIFKGAVFTQLRDQIKKDFVILKSNQLQVHWNENNTITVSKQNIPAGSGNYMTKGSFNREDDFEDIAVSTGSHIKVFKNLRNGYLEATPISVFSIPASKFKIAQITDLSVDYFQQDPIDRADLVVYTGSTVSVYKNTNLNGFEFIASFSVGFQLSDIELADLNDDGYNELIITGINGLDHSVQVYSNNNGSLILSAPAYSNTSQSLIPRNALINVADFNADGYNDLLLCGHEGLTSIFRNKQDHQYFNSTPEQISYLEYPSSSVYQIKSMDIYNTGGIALVMSYQATSGYNLKVVNAVNTNIAPPPPVVSSSSQLVGNYVRPKIQIKNNRGIQDFQKYEIYKAKASTGWNFTYIGQTTDNFFIDNTEYIQYIGGGNQVAPPPNCYYAVKTVDASNQKSILSKQLGYRVGIPVCFACAEMDNTRILEETLQLNVIPEKFSLSNFPNPFNPTTKIYFTLPKEGNVKISVYNSTGQLVKEFNGFRASGYHTVEFDGSAFSSGVYFYRIETNEFTETKRMILAK